MQYKATYKWAVTGTPISTSLNQLQCQAMLLGHHQKGIQVDSILFGCA